MKILIVDDSSTMRKIVMVTTEGGQESINEALARGANGYVEKPFTPDKLKDVLTEVLA